jgi:hypothetical protein
MSVPTWIVRFEGKVSLIDTGAGNDKDRPTLKVLDHLHNPYLERLAAIGVQPETVDEPAGFGGGTFFSQVSKSD